MNWGHRFKELFTRNWREKGISLVLAFLFWFMIKAQDERYAQPYPMPQSVKIAPPIAPAPSELMPQLPQSAQVPSNLKSMLPAPPSDTVPTITPDVDVSPPSGL